MLSRHRVQIDPSLDEQQLIDPDVINRFVDYCEIEPTETVLEIGPGAGNLTQGLLDRARYLICIEKNPKYIPILEERFKGSGKIKIIKDDALKTYLPKHERLVSNLPYMISEPFFQRTLRHEFKSATFIVPSGFAETVTAEPNSHEYTKLSWLAGLFYQIELLETVPSEAYLPEPRVSTAIISLKPRPKQSQVEKTLEELIRQGDKYTKNALREALIRSEWMSAKNEARAFVEEMKLEDNVLDSWVSRLSLSELQSLDQKLREK